MESLIPRILHLSELIERWPFALVAAHYNKSAELDNILKRALSLIIIFIATTATALIHSRTHISNGLLFSLLIFLAYFITPSLVLLVLLFTLKYISFRFLREFKWAAYFQSNGSVSGYDVVENAQQLISDLQNLINVHHIIDGLSLNTKKNLISLVSPRDLIERRLKTSQNSDMYLACKCQLEEFRHLVILGCTGCYSMIRFMDLLSCLIGANVFLIGQIRIIRAFQRRTLLIRSMSNSFNSSDSLWFAANVSAIQRSAFDAYKMSLSLSMDHVDFDRLSEVRKSIENALNKCECCLQHQSRRNRANLAETPKPMGKSKDEQVPVDDVQHHGEAYDPGSVEDDVFACTSSCCEDVVDERGFEDFEDRVNALVSHKNVYRSVMDELVDGIGSRTNWVERENELLFAKYKMRSNDFEVSNSTEIDDETLESINMADRLALDAELRRRLAGFSVSADCFETE